MTDSVHLITLQWSELASQITRPCQVVARLFSRPACRLWPELFHCFLSVVNLRSCLCVRMEFSFLRRRDPGFATSSWNSSSIKLLVGIVNKWLSISASTVVMNRLHGVLTLQEGLSSLCPQWAPFLPCWSIYQLLSPHTPSEWVRMCVFVYFRALSALYLEITLHFAGSHSSCWHSNFLQRNSAYVLTVRVCICVSFSVSLSYSRHSKR